MEHIITRNSWFFCVVCFMTINDVELCATCICTIPDCVECDINGQCATCIPGKFGQQCEKQCAGCETCKSDSSAADQSICLTCRDALYLNQSSGQCLPCPWQCKTCTSGTECPECQIGYYGNDCGSECPSKCMVDPSGKYICEKQTGACSGDCIDGFYGEFCNIICYNCGTNTGHQGCNKWSGKCYSCKDGYYGQDCNMTCGINCVPAYGKDTCDRDTGKCAQCINMWYGPTCDKNCPTNCDSYCNRETGKCIVCKRGFYGQYCNESCPSGCGPEPGTTVTKIVCNTMNAECLHCKSGFYGVRCTKYCEGKCAYDGNAPGCEKSNGRCKGCVKGYFGDFCGSECSHCDGKTCVQDTGHCVNGCEKGWYNKSCTERCSSTCKEEKCDQISGACLIGCINEYSGSFCKTRQPEPVDANKTHLVVIAVVVIGIMLLILAAVLLVVRRYGPSKRKRKALSGYSPATAVLHVNEERDANDVGDVMESDIQSPANHIPVADLSDSHIAEVHVDTAGNGTEEFSTELAAHYHKTLPVVA